VPITGGAMLYDASRAGNAVEGWLDPAWWAERGEVRPAGAGRGSVSFIEADGRSLVLRHYCRGGLAARFSHDRYWWQGAQATRSFTEWHLLYLMHRRGLTVPEPVAARYRRQGRSYTADLLMWRIPDTRTLAECMREAPLPISTWVDIGRCVRRFHLAGVCHADLNAHNVLLDVAGVIWLIDFDRARLRAPGMWSDGNLARLYRSVEKVAQSLPPDRFAAADWSSLLDGYFAEAVALETAA